MEFAFLQPNSISPFFVYLIAFFNKLIKIASNFPLSVIMFSSFKLGKQFKERLRFLFSASVLKYDTICSRASCTLNSEVQMLTCPVSICEIFIKSSIKFINRVPLNWIISMYLFCSSADNLGFLSRLENPIIPFIGVRIS